VSVRKWVIAGVALMFVAAMTVTVWLFTRSDGPRGYYTEFNPDQDFKTPLAAVLAVCHADPAFTPWTAGMRSGPLRYTEYDVHVKVGVPLIWKSSSGAQPLVAVLLPTGTSRFSVATCDAHIYVGP
jgi:hypothetical protein